MSTLVFDNGPEVRPKNRAKRLFSLTMIIGTLAPILALVLYFFLKDTRYTSFEMQVFLLILLFARGHAGETILMYFDNSFRDLIKHNKNRFIYIPTFLLIFLPVILMSNEYLFNAALFIVIPWNLWHFSRQNVGVCALVSLAEGRPTPGKFEKNLINATCVLAIFALYPLGFPNPVGVDWLHALILQIGDLAFIPFLGIIAAALGHIMINRARHSTVTATFFILALTFFSMIYVGRALDPKSMFMVAVGYGAAHAFQYTIIMYLMTSAAYSTGDLVVKKHVDVPLPRKTFYAWRYVPAVAVTASLLLWGLYRLNADLEMNAASGFSGADAITRWFFASVTTLLYIHFIVDAGAFRLSEKPQRDWVRGRLGFLFQK